MAEREDDGDKAKNRQVGEEGDNGENCKLMYGPGKSSGSTAVVAIMRGLDLYVANAGDSRCIVSQKGTYFDNHLFLIPIRLIYFTTGKAIEMSFDHKPEDEPESERIVKAGGYICSDGRVEGGLNLSRAIGDHAYKRNTKLSDREQMITALPDVRKLTIDPSLDDFMVLACDGIWTCMSSQEVVNFVAARIDKEEKLSKICEEVCA